MASDAAISVGTPSRHGQPSFCHRREETQRSPYWVMVDLKTSNLSATLIRTERGPCKETWSLKTLRRDLEFEDDRFKVDIESSKGEKLRSYCNVH
jgi:hypothetical protein